MPPKHYFTSSLTNEVLTERKEALNRVLAVLVPEHAGIPAVRSFLRFDTGEEMERIRKKKEEKRDWQRRASGVGVSLTGAFPFATAELEEVRRREAMPQMKINCQTEQG